MTPVDSPCDYSLSRSANLVFEVQLLSRYRSNVELSSFVAIIFYQGFTYVAPSVLLDQANKPTLVKARSPRKLTQTNSSEINDNNLHGRFDNYQPRQIQSVFDELEVMDTTPTGPRLVQSLFFGNIFYSIMHLIKHNFFKSDFFVPGLPFLPLWLICSEFVLAAVVIQCKLKFLLYSSFAFGPTTRLFVGFFFSKKCFFFGFDFFVSFLLL